MTRRQKVTSVRKDTINLVIVGTMALDSVKTPFGETADALGGSATYAALAASYFVQPGVVSIIGQDFADDHISFLQKHQIDLAGVEHRGQTFRWSGSYEYDMNQAKTHKTELNCLADFNPKLPKSYINVQFVFLANFDPTLQSKVLDQLDHRTFVVLDTMNYWIATNKVALCEVISRVNMLVINEGEARQLCDSSNLIKAGRILLDMGPEYVIIKKGEHGALLFSRHAYFSAPSYPLEELRDPTGAGDSFAGGLIGYLAGVGVISDASIRRSIIYGSAIASCCAEAFSADYRSKTKLADIEERFETLKKIREF